MLLTNCDKKLHQSAISSATQTPVEEQVAATGRQLEHLNCFPEGTGGDTVVTSASDVANADLMVLSENMTQFLTGLKEREKASLSDFRPVADGLEIMLILTSIFLVFDFLYLVIVKNKKTPETRRDQSIKNRSLMIY